MKRYFFTLLAVAGLTITLIGQGSDYPARHYNKYEYTIPMRDGVELFTAVYVPKDTSRDYPILMKRTPYSCRPYGTDQYPGMLGPNKYLMQDGYIFVYQDVRGRWMSEGQYDNMRPHVPGENPEGAIDESTDTYDSIDWLLKNLKHHNGRVGLWGISYPGFYATAGSVDAHPALKASSPQAPIGDFYFDDFHHNGAYFLSYWRATSVFGYQHDGPTPEAWYSFPDLGSVDQYQFFLDAGPLKNLDKYYGKDNFFWQQLKEHPDYDEFWQKRGIIQHLENITPNMMIVGGWFDAEDLYGPLNTYQAIEKNNPNTYNTIVMGPWSHGDWSRNRDRQAVSNVFFGEDISDFYQFRIERTFFDHFLKGSVGDSPDLPEAFMFDTGRKSWSEFGNWPPEGSQTATWYLRDGQDLSYQAPEARDADYSEYVSDPKKPVPYSEDIQMVFTPRKYMADDQRFAARRPDVLIFETEVLEDEVTLAGPIMANLKVSTTGTAADWVVKLVDVYPADHPDYDETQDHLRMGNYHQMVRSEAMRGRYRNSFSEPEPFAPNTVTDVSFKLQDVYHTFKKGHKIQIQVQSTWFPLIDLNPQTYVDNIFMANAEDFQKQMHRIYHSPGQASTIEVTVLPK